jgi:hypothetical protein
VAIGGGGDGDGVGRRRPVDGGIFTYISSEAAFGSRIPTAQNLDTWNEYMEYVNDVHRLGGTGSGGVVVIGELLEYATGLFSVPW